MTKERPILFSAPMVRAILAGTKTQTRRAVKGAPDDWAPMQPQAFWTTVVRRGVEEPGEQAYGAGNEDGDCWIVCPYGQPGDRLWVRETLKPWSQDPELFAYAADDTKAGADGGGFNYPVNPGRPYVPSIHLPRAWSRILLEITSIRVERLQEISEADAVAEGCVAKPFPGPWWQGYRDMGDGDLMHTQAVGETPPDWMVEPKRMRDHSHLDVSAAAAFRALWWGINGAESWTANPWVWVVEFKRAG